MTSLLLALILMCLTSVWRFYDGTGKSLFRKQSIFHLAFLQTSTPAALCLIAGLLAIVPHQVWSGTLSMDGIRDHWYSPLLAAGLVFYLLIRAPGGWEYWLPNRSASGERRLGTLLTYFVPMLLCADAFYLLQYPPLPVVLLAIAGLVPCLVYVLGSQLEERRKDQGYAQGGAFQLPFGGYWTAEELGRVSMGALVFPLPLL